MSQACIMRLSWQRAVKHWAGLKGGLHQMHVQHVMCTG